MRLTFDYEYANYEDEINWTPRLAELQRFFQNMREQNYENMTVNELFEGMEQLEELMRFYAATNNFTDLEPVMRLQSQLLEYCSNDSGSVEILYLKMEFARLNALLYRSQERNQQAATYFNEASGLASQCFSLLQQERNFSGKQKLFVGWACTEIFNESAQCFEVLLDSEKTLVFYKKAVQVLEWIEQFWADARGIQDTASELYTTFGGYFYQYQLPKLGKECFERAIKILEKLGLTEEYWRSRAIFVKSIYGVQEFLNCGNQNVMYACEQEANLAISEMEILSAQAIARAALGLILLQKGIVLRQKNELKHAVSTYQRSCKELKKALEVLENFKCDFVTSRVNSSYIAAMEALGQLLFSMEQHDEAKKILTETLTYLSDTKYGYGEGAMIVIRAECMLYLMYIEMFESNMNQATFYGTQVAQLTKEAAVQNSHPSIKELEITSCCGLAELYLGLKDKKKAYEYSVQGLEACACLERIVPNAPALELKGALEKYNKKSQRRFF